MQNSREYTGFTVARGAGMKPIARMLTEDSPWIGVPKELPTYARVNAIHCGITEDEVRMRAASLENSYLHSETERPVPKGLVIAFLRSGTVTGEQADRVRDFIRSQKSEYLKDEARLLLEAGGHDAGDKDGPAASEGRD